MNTKDQIKQAIKEAGFNLRQVSVRSRRGGYDSSFCLTIRDASVSKKQIKEIAKLLEIPANTAKRFLLN